MSHARADLYVLGASYTANGIDQFPPGPMPESPNGDDLWSNGPVWVAAYATATGHPVPISSNRTAVAGETRTNFARGGAHITSSSGTGGVTRPKDAGEQWQECKYFLAANGAPTEDDIFVTSSFGPDILSQYEISQGNVVDSDFLAARVGIIGEIIDDAIASGFQTVLVANLAPLDRTQAVINNFDAATRDEFKADIEEFNVQLECLIRRKAGSPQLTILALDMMSAITETLKSPQSFGFVNNYSAIFDCNTGHDPDIVMWWDCLHPSEGLHDLLAGEVEEFSATGLSTSSDFEEGPMDEIRWGDDVLVGGASLQESNQRLEYQVPSPDMEDYAARPWILNLPCYCVDWETIVDVTNTVTPTQAGQSAIIGLEVFNLKDFPDSFDSVYVGLTAGAVAGGGPVAVERGIRAGMSVDDVRLDNANHIITPDTTAAVRLTFNARTKVFTAYYDLDGPGNGYTWHFLSSFGVTGNGGNIANGDWGMVAGDSFDVYVIGSSEEIFIASGDAFADNFSLQMAPATIPTLQVQLVKEGIQLLWPASAIGYGLESSLDLSLESWFQITQPVTAQNGANTLLLPTNGSRQFFRLQRPASSDP